MDIKTLIISPPPPLPVFFTMFLTIYLLAHFIVFRNWTPKTRPEAASCLISLTHGTPAAILAGIAIFFRPKTPLRLTQHPLPKLRSRIRIAYFIMDLIHYLTFYPTDVYFIGHHLATLFVVYYVPVRCVPRSVFCNVWTLAGARKGDSEVARQVFDKMSVWFYGVYSVVRGVGAPLFVYRMVGFYASGVADSVVPRWLWVSWVCVVVAAISVSVLWVSNNWVELF
ncbi:putative TLC domain-containing protein [Helianthus annuus]|nr:putative TLC domain-containing protein [Helianthus annuus]